MEKENNSNEGDFSENEIPDLNSLKPFEFKPETNIGDINSSSSDDEEEGAEYKVKRISNNEWCECSAKAVVGRCSSKWVSGLQLYEETPRKVLSYEIYEIFKNTFFYRTSLL